MDQAEKERIEVRDTQRAMDFYEVLKEELDQIESYEVKCDLLVNLAKYLFKGKVAEAQASGKKLSDEDAVAIVHKECEDFCRYVMMVPEQYGNRLARDRERQAVSLLAFLFDGAPCPCDKCVAARAKQPTERPPAEAPNAG